MNRSHEKEWFLVFIVTGKLELLFSFVSSCEKVFTKQHTALSSLAKAMSNEGIRPNQKRSRQFL